MIAPVISHNQKIATAGSFGEIGRLHTDRFITHIGSFMRDAMKQERDMYPRVEVPGIVALSTYGWDGPAEDVYPLQLDEEIFTEIGIAYRAVLSAFPCLTDEKGEGLYHGAFLSCPESGPWLGHRDDRSFRVLTAFDDVEMLFGSSDCEPVLLERGTSWWINSLTTNPRNAPWHQRKSQGCLLRFDYSPRASGPCDVDVQIRPPDELVDTDYEFLGPDT